MIKSIAAPSPTIPIPFNVPASNACGSTPGCVFENDKIREQEMNLIEIFYKKIQKIQGIKIYHEKQLDLTKQTAICSINLEEYDSGSVSDELMERFQIQTRSGAHCAPLVHEHFGTIEQGMVRFSFGHETTMKEINQIINAVKILAEE